MPITETSARITRWRLRLAEFDFDNKYKTEKENIFPNAISFLQTGGETETGDDYDISSLHITWPTVTTVQTLDLDDPYYEDPDELPGFIEQE